MLYEPAHELLGRLFSTLKLEWVDDQRFLSHVEAPAAFDYIEVWNQPPAASVVPALRDSRGFVRQLKTALGQTDLARILTAQQQLAGTLSSLR